MHAIGARCRELVVKHVRRRFGPHRFGGRYAAEVEDIVQECYQKLLAPSGISSFTPDPGRSRSDAFRAWLWRVVHYHCNNKTDYFRRQLRRSPTNNCTDWHVLTTPGGVLAQTLLRALNDRAVEAVERSWRAKGPKWSKRFDVLLSLLYAKEADTKRACVILGIKDGNLRILKRRLRLAVLGHVRAQIREDLRLDPKMHPAAIERCIDQELFDLFHTAYPCGEVPYVFRNEDDRETEDDDPDPDPDPDHHGEQPGATA